MGNSYFKVFSALHHQSSFSPFVRPQQRFVHSFLLGRDGTCHNSAVRLAEQWAGTQQLEAQPKETFDSNSGVLPSPEGKNFHRFPNGSQLPAD